MKLKGQFWAGGDDRTKIIKHEHSAEVVSRFDGCFRDVPITQNEKKDFLHGWTQMDTDVKIARGLHCDRPAM